MELFLAFSHLGLLFISLDLSFSLTLCTFLSRSPGLIIFSLLFPHAVFHITQESSRSLLSLLPALRARIAASLTASAAAAIKEHVPKIMTAYRMTGTTVAHIIF